MMVQEVYEKARIFVIAFTGPTVKLGQLLDKISDINLR